VLLGSTLSEHGFWIASRAAGTSALLCSSAAVGVAVAASGRVLRARVRDLRPVHEALSLATLAALVVHAAALLGDSYLHPGIADLAVPFVSPYERWWMAAGITGAWMLLVLGLSYYARGRIGPQRWRRLHRLTGVAWVLGVAHAVAQGTDVGAAWFLVAGGLVTLPAAVLLIARLAGTEATV
jgi:methionine sulfoxide reductase heme-binding subunit